MVVDGFYFPIVLKCNVEFVLLFVQEGEGDQVSAAVSYLDVVEVEVVGD